MSADLLIKFLGVAPAVVALLVAISGLTSASRRRRLEAYYRAAADDEKGRSAEREAILRSLQREAVGWSIADRAVSKGDLLAPIVAYAFVTMQQFFSGRFLARDLAAGKRVWRGPFDLTSPDTLVGAVVWTAFFGVLVVGFISPAIRYYFLERRRIVAAYMRGAPAIVHRTFWSHQREVWATRQATGRLPVAAGSALGELQPPHLFRLKLMGAGLGSAALVTNFGLLSVGGDLAVSRAGGWVAVLGVGGTLGFFFLGGGLLVGALADRLFDREWRHPIGEPLETAATRSRQVRPRLAPARRVARSRRLRSNNRPSS